MKFSFVFFALALTVVVSLVLSFPVMLLWNYCLVPAISGLSTISLLQAWGIMVLFRFFTSTSVKVEPK